MIALHDMHCHLDFMANGEEVAAAAQADGTLLFANTVTPEGWIAARKRFAAYGNVVVGFGMHPWWVPTSTGDAQTEYGAALELLRSHEPMVIGEIGLDFGWRHVESREAQLALFAAFARWAATAEDRLISLHSIKAAREVLDILEQEGTLKSCLCIFHWFTGPSDQLKRAIDAGCYFSCGPRTLATGKGREYVKAIPSAQLLLETDAPPEEGAPYPYTELRSGLESVAQSIARIKGEAALEVIAQTSERLLGPFRPTAL